MVIAWITRKEFTNYSIRLMTWMHCVESIILFQPGFEKLLKFFSAENMQLIVHTLMPCDLSCGIFFASRAVMYFMNHFSVLSFPSGRESDGPWPQPGPKFFIKNSTDILDLSPLPFYHVRGKDYQRLQSIQKRQAEEYPLSLHWAEIYTGLAIPERNDHTCARNQKLI